MPLYLNGYSDYAMSSSDPAGRAINQSSNAGHQSQARTLNAFETGRTFTGVVIRAGAGLYDVVVKSVASPELPCVVAVTDSCYYYGTSDCVVPTVGSQVLVYKPLVNANFGVVVRTLPPADTTSPVDEDGNAPQTFYQMWDIEPGKSAMTENAYRSTWEDPEAAKINANAGRPLDIFPGNRAWINEQGVGMAILNLLAAFRATDRAKIEVSALDDLVRVVSGYFRHINAQGEDQIYNDGGYLTRELTATSYQCEKSGYTAYGEALFEEEDGDMLGQAAKSRYKLAEEQVAAKKRVQLFMGYLGDIINLFVANPDPNQDPETATADSVDQGLLHMHLDASGRMIMRSAAGISLQRDDVIPVPKKKHEPWDPDGDKLDAEPTVIFDEAFPTEKPPFEWSTEYPYGRSLQMRDATVFRNAQAVQRVSDQSQSASKKDYFLPEARDMPTPDNEYDPNGKASENFEDNAGRKSHFNLEDDGSIVIRDAWGSEIVMRGGNIILNCAGQMEIRSGKSIVQLAGHDVITKAKNSVDITATDHDVRVKAERNLQMVAEGKESGGGILLESKATRETIGYEDRTGEQVVSSGIVLKAADSRVFLEGKKIHVAGRDNVIVETFNEDGEIDGDILISAKNVYTSATRQNALTTGENAGFILTARQGIIAAPATMLLGGRSLILTRGAKAWVPFMEVDIEQNPYSIAKSAFIEKVYTNLQASDEWLNPFDPETRKDIEFTYRSSSEYGTLRATEVSGANTFVVYQATWAYLKSIGDPLIGGELETWEETPIEDTYPWPGKEAYEAESYVKLSEENNIDGEGKPKIRKEVSNTPGALATVGFNEYEVLA